MYQSIKNFLLWSLTFAVFFGILISIFHNLLSNESEKLSWIEIVVHSCLFGILVSAYGKFKEAAVLEKFLAKTFSLTPRWQYQIGQGFGFTVYITLAMILFKSKSELIEEINSGKFLFGFVFYLLLFVFGWGYLSWKGYDSWNGIFGKGKKKQINNNYEPQTKIISLSIFNLIFLLFGIKLLSDYWTIGEDAFWELSKPSYYLGDLVFCLLIALPFPFRKKEKQQNL